MTDQKSKPQPWVDPKNDSRFWRLIKVTTPSGSDKHYANVGCAARLPNADGEERNP